MAVAGCFVTTIIPAKNDDLPIFNARVILPLRPPEPQCTVSDCRLCHKDGSSVFINGTYITMDLPPHRIVFAFKYGHINFRILPILERAYCGNIVALYKGVVDVVYLTVPPIYRDEKYGSLDVKFADFSILFYPVPIQNYGLSLSDFCLPSILDGALIPINDAPNYFLLRDPLPPGLLHFVRHLILQDANRRNRTPPDVRCH